MADIVLSDRTEVRDERANAMKSERSTGKAGRTREMEGWRRSLGRTQVEQVQVPGGRGRSKDEDENWYLEIQVPRYPGTLEPRYPRTQVPQNPVTSKPRYSKTQVLQNPGTPEPSYFKTQVLQNPGTSKPRYFKTQVLQNLLLLLHPSISSRNVNLGSTPACSS